MRGPDELVPLVVARLAEEVPLRLDEIEARRALAPIERPRLYSDSHFPRIEGGQDWPAVMVSSRGILDVLPLDPPVDPPADLYATLYGVRIFGLSRGQDYGDTAQAERRLLQAIVEALLLRPGLDADFALVPRTIRTDEDQFPGDRSRTIAAGFVEASFRGYETIPRTSRGPVATTRVDVAKVGIEAAFP